MTNPAVVDFKLLGPDIWYKILEFLSTTDKYLLEKTCTYFEELLERNSIWEAAYDELRLRPKETALLWGKEQETEQPEGRPESRKLVHDLLDQRLYLWGSLGNSGGHESPEKSPVYAVPTLLPQLADFPIRKAVSAVLDEAIFLILLTFDGEIYILHEALGGVGLKKAEIETGEIDVPKFNDLVAAKTNFVLLSGDENACVYHSSASDLKWGKDGIPSLTFRKYPYSENVEQLVCTDAYFAIRTETMIMCEIFSPDAAKFLRTNTLYYSGEDIIDISGNDSRFCRLSDEGMIMTTNILPTQGGETRSLLSNDYTSATPRRMGMVERLFITHDAIYVLNSDGEVWLSDESILQLPQEDVWFQHDQDANNYQLMESVQDVQELAVNGNLKFLLDSKGRVFYWGGDKSTRDLFGLFNEHKVVQGNKGESGWSPELVCKLPCPVKAILTDSSICAAVVKIGHSNDIEQEKNDDGKQSNMRHENKQALQTFTIGALGRYFNRPLKRSGSDLQSDKPKEIKTDHASSLDRPVNKDHR